MSNLFFQCGCLVLYLYYCYQIDQIEKGKGKLAVLLGIAAGIVVAFSYWNIPELGWVFITGTILLYLLFYGEEAFRSVFGKAAMLGILVVVSEFVILRTKWVSEFTVGSVLLWISFLLLAGHREYLNVISGIFTAVIYGILVWLTCFQSENAWIYLTLATLIFGVLEMTLYHYQKGYETQTRDFQQNVLLQQYDEIKNIYMNMRGWRHDYHNHIQVIKAQMALQEWEEAKQYLDELEQDLERVDTYVKSGNLMIDAILNSKLTLAEHKRISVNCKAQVPEELEIADVDLCVILGNLLDNALEACDLIPIEKRFLRIYCVVNGKQFYLSIQNSAKEDPDFNERNYITNKRGEHGFGMRRVKLLVDKYQGYLNLQNEPGIFATEVTLPLGKLQSV